MADRLQKKLDLLIALAVTLAGFFLYALTAAPSVLFADSGEYQFVAYTAGIAHSTESSHAGRYLAGMPHALSA